MKAQIDQYKGWYIYGEVDSSDRFAQVITWTAEKDNDSTTLQAGTVTALKELIDLREADTFKALKEFIDQREAQHE